eukprot:EC794652.1.p3 GENE.EC794652.1~~EC794652.1.p3  ORF type:complete len:55 (-),score=1.39 EC794652.1:7-171(-)
MQSSGPSARVRSGTRNSGLLRALLHLAALALQSSHTLLAPTCARILPQVYGPRL